MEISLLKTLACKHSQSVAVLARKYKTLVHDSSGARLSCIEVRVNRDRRPPLVARFGGIRLCRRVDAELIDAPPVVWNRRTELLSRLLANTCEQCGAREDIEVHHVRKLADLNRPRRRPKQPWERVMIARRRKTLVLCRACHVALHAGNLEQRRSSSTIARLPNTTKSSDSL